MNCKGCDCASKAQYLPAPDGLVEITSSMSAGEFRTAHLSATRFRQVDTHTAIDYLDMAGLPVLAVLHEATGRVYDFSQYDAGWGEMGYWTLAEWVGEFCA